MITHLEPDILECEVKWTLGSITMNKTSGGDGIPVELFKILKDDAVKVLHSICQQIWKNEAVATGLEKVSFHSNPKQWVSEWVKPLSHVRLFATPWTVAYQAPPSMGFSRQEYWNGLPFPSPGDLPNSGIELGSPTFQVDTLTSEPPGKPKERDAKECSNYHTTTLISYARKVMLKILQQASTVHELWTSRCTSWI